ncbi:MAG: type II toxin-antitoxin system death-on-curing family toxin [Planctomycetaceae bacterium]
MTEPIHFLTVDDVLQIHRRMIAEFGGTPEVRDVGLLQSAVSMPQARFGGQYLHAGVPEMAAAYLYHICANHPIWTATSAPRSRRAKCSFD